MCSDSAPSGLQAKRQSKHRALPCAIDSALSGLYLKALIQQYNNRMVDDDLTIEGIRAGEGHCVVIYWGSQLPLGIIHQ